jgi:hypothetical protein
MLVSGKFIILVLFISVSVKIRQEQEKTTGDYQQAPEGFRCAPG